MNDLLYAFMGHGGTYIRARLVSAPSAGTGGAPSASTPVAGSLENGTTAGGGDREGGGGGRPMLTFVVAADLDPSLHEMVERVLPMW